jgi:hypothetical protein
VRELENQSRLSRRGRSDQPIVFSRTLCVPPKDGIRGRSRVRGYNPQMGTSRTCALGVVFGSTWLLSRDEVPRQDARRVGSFER